MENQICPVDVISVCSTDGNIRPLRLRMEDDCKQLVRVDIEEVISTRQIHYVGIECIIFLCTATVGRRRKVFELRYLLRDHTWCLMRSMC